MNILILGGGRVGRSLARHFDAEDDNITVVDDKAHQLDIIRSKFDVQLVEGVASDPRVLRLAGVESADLLIAVTPDDETNILSCHVAHQFSSSARKLCRVRLPGYWTYRNIIANDSSGRPVIDHFISPQRVVTSHIKRLIDLPGSLQVIDFAKKNVKLIVVRVHQGGIMVNKRIKELKNYLPAHVEVRVVALYRRGDSITPEGETEIAEGDEVFFITAGKNAKRIMKEWRRVEKPYKSITIAGGGHVGYRLAKALEDDGKQVKIIDNSRERARYVSERLEDAIVLHGDATDSDLLTQEEISVNDVFIALTNSDEANLISSLLAKSLGTRQVMTLLNNPDYVRLLENSQIDVPIAPDLITISSMLAYARHGDTAEAHTLRRGAAEALEVIVHGDYSTSKVIGRCVDELRLPPGIMVGAIVRQDGEVIIAHGCTQIVNNDHIILFVNSRSLIVAVEQFFGASAR